MVILISSEIPNNYVFGANLVCAARANRFRPVLWHLVSEQWGLRKTKGYARLYRLRNVDTRIELEINSTLEAMRHKTLGRGMFVNLAWEAKIAIKFGLGKFHKS